VEHTADFKPISGCRG